MILNEFVAERRALVKFRTAVEDGQWKREHDAAMLCHDLQDLVAIGVSLYKDFVRLDERWRLAIARGEIEYDEERANCIDLLFAWWLHPCEVVERRIAACELDGFEVEAAAEFRECYAKALSVSQDA